MNITVNLFASFREGRFDKEARCYAEGVTLRQIVAEVGIEEKDIGMSLINGCHAPLEHAVCDGDDVFLFPMLTGG